MLVFEFIFVFTIIIIIITIIIVFFIIMTTIYLILFNLWCVLFHFSVVKKYSFAGSYFTFSFPTPLFFFSITNNLSQNIV